jgi:hypothetical protein
MSYSSSPGSSSIIEIRVLVAEHIGITYERTEYGDVSSHGVHIDAREFCEILHRHNAVGAHTDHERVTHV